MSKVNELFKKELKVINIGTDLFVESLRKQGVKVIHVDWRPPAGGDVKLAELLEKVSKK